MANLQLSMIFSSNDRSRPVIDGLVQPEGIDLTITTAHPSEIFWRQLHFAEFDVSEMSMSSLLMVVARGDSPWVALPVFTARHFFHTRIIVRADAGIEAPADLRGKRVGVPEYQQTAALWARAALQHEWGVSPSEMEWYMERTEEMSHGGGTGFQPPPGIHFHRIPADQSIASLLLAGELDASLLYLGERNLVDRSGVNLDDDARVRMLFPDPAAEGARYFAKTGFFPINHGMVVRRSILEEHPWVALNLYKAFLTAKDQAAARARELLDPYFRTGLLGPEARAAVAQDPYPYGVKANRAILEQIARYSHEQGLTPREIGLEEVFAASTLEI